MCLYMGICVNWEDLMLTRGGRVPKIMAYD